MRERQAFLDVAGREGNSFVVRMPYRRTRDAIVQALLLLATAVAALSLSALTFNIIDQSFGLVLLEERILRESLAVGDRSLEELSQAELVEILRAQLRPNLLQRLESERPLPQRSQAELYALVMDRVVQPKIVRSWSLFESLFGRKAILQELGEPLPPGQRLMWRSWLNPKFVTSPAGADPLRAGVRTAILGSLWLVAIAMALALPLGIGAAVYLEEYATPGRAMRLVELNIGNLAGIPSIIYGMLGLALFVRALQPLTSGALFGMASPAPNGRTVISAGLTLGLLVLPIIIINAQEAIRAVPSSLRLASYALGATKWQTIWHHVLPSALPGILTGSILALARAIGETAPLIVVGAATFITVDPKSPFSPFTALPIQIHQWTTRPQAEFRHLAAAAIIVLLLLLLVLNAAAVLLRARYSRRQLE